MLLLAGLLTVNSFAAKSAKKALKSHVREIDVQSVYDGDTIKAHVDMNYKRQWQHNEKLRILGIDTPEVRHSDKLHNAAYVRTLIKPGRRKAIFYKVEGRGRWLVTIPIGKSTLCLKRNLPYRAAGNAQNGLKRNCATSLKH